MAGIKPENVEDFYEIGEVLGRYGYNISKSLPVSRNVKYDAVVMYLNIYTLDLKSNTMNNYFSALI